MKSRKPLLILLVSGSLFAGSLMAQDQTGTMPPPPPPPPAQQQGTMPPPPPAPSQAPGTPTGQAGPMNTPQGEVTVKSSMPSVNYGPPPDFATLSGGKNCINEDQAAAYPLLANDFIHADRNRNGCITKAEYNAWSRH
ncbi:hypothetical protein EYV96_01565 [Dyella terrae]|uniref:EF-hand domain-containing protein n=3 Tax=Rhodanobacteraceae TaxID=1775411 RepID=A0A4R0Z242_9GAMM|nr:hypothetical protein EYV96_01565 [Dyella terrae]TCI13889.1 hypothetical protein EZM97_09305 [Dyella soli]